MVRQQTSSRKVVMPFCKINPLWKRNVATAMSTRSKKHTGQRRKPITRHIPPKNSVDLQIYALSSGQGMPIAWSVPAKSTIPEGWRRDNPYRMKITPTQALSRNTAFDHRGSPAPRSSFISYSSVSSCLQKMPSWRTDNPQHVHNH